MRVLMTQKSCAVGMRNAILRNYLKNAMRVYAAELICSTEVSGFQTFKPVFCIYNKLRLHAEILS